jgi:hypothetical protein
MSFNASVGAIVRVRANNGVQLLANHADARVE